MVSPTRWGSLPLEIQSILHEEARATQVYVYETAKRLDSELVGQIREAGVLVNQPDRKPFLDASAELYIEFGLTVESGDSLLERAAAAGSN